MPKLNHEILNTIQRFIRETYAPGAGVVSKQSMYSAFAVWFMDDQYKAADKAAEEDKDLPIEERFVVPDETVPMANLFFSHLAYPLAKYLPEATLTRARVDGVFGPWSYRGIVRKDAASEPPAPANEEVY